MLVLSVVDRHLVCVFYVDIFLKLPLRSILFTGQNSVLFGTVFFFFYNCMDAFFP